MKKSIWIVILLFAIWGGILLLLPGEPKQQDAAPAISSTPISSTAPTAPPSYLARIDQATWDYYKLIALQNEYGAASSQGSVKKWMDSISVFVGIYHTDEDLHIISKHIEDLNKVPGIPAISITDSSENANVTILFITQADMNQMTADHGEIAHGYTTVWWDQGSITKSEIYIVYDEQTQLERQHTLLEEMTQARGLLNDAILYDDSIFYVEYKPDILSLSSMDWKLLEIHYSDLIEPGMKEAAGEDLYRQAHL
ncbi:MAG: DUF2927 domain-containing protein [Clostridia bacterium]|nr:DUF2927 domain-containing protein [Clostridia bacterium]